MEKNPGKSIDINRVPKKKNVLVNTAISAIFTLGSVNSINAIPAASYNKDLESELSNLTIVLDESPPPIVKSNEQSPDPILIYPPVPPPLAPLSIPFPPPAQMLPQTVEEKGPEIDEPEYKAEFSHAKAIVMKNKGTLSKFFLEDARSVVKDFDMYFPFYDAAAEKFGGKTPWYLIWIIHEAETSDSRGLFPDGRSRDHSIYVGAGQRDPRSWPQKLADNAGKGLEYLSKLPQRARTDWKELAFVAWYFKTHQSKSPKFDRVRDILKPLLWYSSDTQAIKRYHQYLTLRKLFGDKNK